MNKKLLIIATTLIITNLTISSGRGKNIQHDKETLKAHVIAATKKRRRNVTNYQLRPTNPITQELIKANILITTASLTSTQTTLEALNNSPDLPRFQEIMFDLSEKSNFDFSAMELSEQIEFVEDVLYNNTNDVTVDSELNILKRFHQKIFDNSMLEFFRETLRQEYNSQYKRKKRAV